ncbi:MAG TPA: hypothetical protein VL176_03645, partial [Steroidobacteraceae bacterium]|nr:hypothetical protein [Steroidobacteraceae bacterium]
TTGAQTQTISGATGISLTGGASGGGLDGSNNSLGNFARITNTNGSQSVSAGSGGITLTGGGGSLTSNFALIIQGQSTGTAGTTQTVTINNGGTLSLQGGSSAQTNVINNSGNLFRGSYAMVQANGDSQLFSFPGGGAISLTGGSVGSNNVAQILSRFGLQTISGAPSITLQGGTGGYVDVATNKNEGNFANLNSNAGQSITASAISLTGGASGVGNHAQIFDGGTSTAQTITATTISMLGGAGGGTDAGTGSSSFGNYANIQATGTGTQSITATGLSLQAGASGQENFAAITAPTQQVTVHGDLSLTGGGSIAGTLRGGGARIGGPGGSGPAPTDLTLAVDGNVTMTGGSVADAGTAIGSNNLGGQPTTIVMSAGGNITLNPGTAANSGSRIGSPASGIAGGDIAITAGGTLALNSTGPGLGTAIRTLGNLTITAASMTEGPDSVIIAGGTTSISGGTVSLPSATNQFGTVLLNTTGNVTITDVDAINLGTSTTGSGGLAVTAPGGITQSGPLTVAGASTLNAGANAITLTNVANDFGGAVNFTGSNVSITDANAIAIGNSNASGALNIVAASTSFLNGLNATNYSFSGGTYSLAAGTYNLGGTTSIAQNPSTGAVTVVDVATGATINTSGGTVNVGAGGTLSGTGTIQGNVNNVAGTVSPGASPGMLTITGNYTQAPSGTLNMEIGGLVAGTQYDQLVVQGSTSLAGTLNTSLVNGFVPVSGSTFTLIQSSGPISGTFTTVNQPLGALFNTFYGPVTVDFVAASASGGSIPVQIIPVVQATIVSTDQVLIGLNQPTTTSAESGVMLVKAIDVSPATEARDESRAAAESDKKEEKSVAKKTYCN